jgi:hypothetical protein
MVSEQLACAIEHTVLLRTWSSAGTGQDLRFHSRVTKTKICEMDLCLRMCAGEVIFINNITFCQHFYRFLVLNVPFN